MPNLSDEELVAACLEGRDSAWAALVERYSPRVRGIAVRLCRDRRDAEEAVQEALIQISRDLAKWKPIAPLEAWIVTITVRTAQKVDARANRAAKGVESLDRPLPDGGSRELQDRSATTDPSVAMDRSELSARIREAIAGLPPKPRAVMELRQEGLSTKEIAAALGIPEGTVRVHAHRGAVELRQALGDLGQARRQEKL
jgi:RNA polymerase sigma factor (sigma-70 family)